MAVALLPAGELPNFTKIIAWLGSADELDGHWPSRLRDIEMDQVFAFAPRIS